MTRSVHSVCIGLLAMLLFASPAMPLSLKKSLAVILLFEENKSTVSEPEKLNLKRVVEQVRTENWCPLEAVVLVGYASLKEGTPEQASVISSKRIEEVIGLLHSYGIPTIATFGENRGAIRSPGSDKTPPSARVEVEFVGMAPYEKCLVPQTETGFRVR